MRLIGDGGTGVRDRGRDRGSGWGEGGGEEVEGGADVSSNALWMAVKLMMRQ